MTPESLSDQQSRDTQDQPTSPQPQTVSWWFSRLIPIASLLAAGIAFIVLLGLGQRTGWIKTGSAPSTAATAGEEQIYTCPMHPQIRQPGEGRCPICGMPLVPASSSAGGADKMAVNIDPVQRRLANIQTELVKKQPLNNTIETIGAIQIDESRQATIASYIDGRLERLFADYTGVEVDKGDHLAVVYSPQLYGAQVEFLESRKALKGMTGGALASVRQVQEKLVTNSQKKLVELGMTKEQIANLESSEKAESRLTIYAPIGGTVTQKMAEEGKYIKSGDAIYRIANLSTVWLMLELYPEDASRIRFGQRVNAELQSLPGEILEGRIAFIDPTVNTAKRTVGVRVEFNNDQGTLRPGDYAKATITIPTGPQGEVYDSELAGKWISPMHPQVIRDEPGDCPICGMKLVSTSRYGYADQPVDQVESLFIPRSAVLMAGEHSVVYVETKPGRFELRGVTLGPILRDKAVVLSGLKVGEKVATAGNFLIDSQMQLAGKPSLIDPTRYVAKKGNENRNTPLEFDSIDVVQIAGPAGELLENFYEAYFTIQVALAGDKKPPGNSVAELTTLAGKLAEMTDFSESIRNQFGKAATNAEHLHHLSIEEARKKFKPISHLLVTLATTYRGANAKVPFYHFFCPMVPEGEGDWLQPNNQLINPYFGSQMLNCGDLVRTIPPDANLGKNKNDTKQKHDHSTHSKGEK